MASYNGGGYYNEREVGMLLWYTISLKDQITDIFRKLCQQVDSKIKREDLMFENPIQGGVLKLNV